MGNERIRQIGQGRLEVFDPGSARASRAGDRALAVANFPLSFQRSDGSRNFCLVISDLCPLHAPSSDLLASNSNQD